MLEKNYLTDTTPLKLSPEQTAKLEAIGGRTRIHIERLLQRSDVERNFGLALIEHYEASQKTFSFEHWRNIDRLLSGESINTPLWWTISPYAFKRLIEKGITPKEAIRMLLDWAKVGPEHDDAAINSLPGLEELGYDQFLRAFVLDTDPTHVSHELADYFAEQVVTTLTP